MKSTGRGFGWLLSAKGGKRKGAIEGLPVYDDVELLQDELGIPHIFADNEHDLAVAQGYVHARDRLWQMESGRRVAKGRLSEAAGTATVELDHFALLAGFERIRRRAVERATAENRGLLEAYAAGINAYIDLAGRRKPLEFRILGLKPSRWTADDLCAVLPLNAWFLQTNYHEELVAMLARGRLDSAAFSELYPSSPGARLPYEPFFERYGSARVGPLIPAALAFYPEFAATSGGSNSWVIRNGEGGLPLLANDPHLGMIVPQIWHICHMSCPTMNIAGVSMPGVPGIVLGRNEKTVWGVTNVMTDIVDLYMVQLDPSRPTRYRVADSWLEMDVEEVEIPVWKRAPVKRRIHRTIFGPLLTEIGEGTDAAAALLWYGTLPEEATATSPGERNAADRAGGRSVPEQRDVEPAACSSSALRTAAAEAEQVASPLPAGMVTAESLEDTTVNGFMAMFRAESVEELLEAGSLVRTVGQNLTCGDADGNIAWHATGLAPVRHGYSGRCPADGSSDDNYWEGFLPYGELPHAYNPGAGYIVTANNRPGDGDDADRMSYSWCAPYRREQIAQSIETAGERPTAEDFQRIQRDVHVLQADYLLPRLLSFSYTNPQSVRAADILRGWDREASRDSAGALVFSAFLVEFNRIAAGPLLGDALPIYLSTVTPFFSAVDGALISGDAPALLAGNPHNDLGAVCEAALARAVEIAAEVCGPDPAEWKWGKLHTYLFAHVGGVNRIAAWLLNRGPYPAPGTSTTVNVGAINPANARAGTDTVLTGAGLVHGRRGHRQAEYRAGGIPSMRFTASLAHPDRNFIMGPMGQSGRPGNRHYDDMIGRWIEGEVVRLPLSHEGALEAAKDRLILRA